MRKLIFAGCFLALTTLSSCQDDASSSAQPATTVAPAQAVVLDTSSAGLVQTTTPKGTSVQLDGRFQHAVMARRAADGTVVTECHDDQQQADAFIQSTAPASQKVETK